MYQYLQPQALPQHLLDQVGHPALSEDGNSQDGWGDYGVTGKKLENYEENYSGDFSKLELAQSFKPEKYADKQFNRNMVEDVVDTNLENETKKDNKNAGWPMTKVNF